MIFVGTTAGGLKVAVEDGKLKILKEGRARKFVNKVEQITFSGPYSANSGQTVLYVTERCVFQLTPEGLELIETAPGVDVERDILAHMDFRPIIKQPLAMDPRIFQPEAMKLKDTLLSISLVDRMVYDAPKETVFYNFQGSRCGPKRTSTMSAMPPRAFASPSARRWSITMTSRSMRT